MNIEQEPGEMAYKKNKDKSHADGRQIIFTDPPTFITMLNVF